MRGILTWAIKPRIIEWLFCLIAFTLPIVRPHWNSKIILLLILFSCINLDLKKLRSIIKINKVFWLFLALFLLDVVGMIHSENVNYGLSHLETKFSIFFFPLLVLIHSEVLTPKVTNKICKSFVCGVLVILVGYILIVIIDVLTSGFSYSNFFSDRLSNIPVFLNQTVIAIHPSFLSLYISFCMLFILICYRFNKFNGGVWIYGCVFVVMLFFQIWLNSRAGIVGLALSLIFFFITESSVRSKILSIGVVIIFFIVLMAVPIVRERFVNAPIRAMQHYGEVDNLDPISWPISFRLQIFDCSISILQNNHWIWGYGTGDFRDKITQCYQEKEYGWLTVRGFDAHNEFFSQMHRHGIFGLIIFVACLGVPLIKSSRKDQLLYIVFIIMIMVSSLPESILTSQKGVVFYALFNSLLCPRQTNSLR